MQSKDQITRNNKLLHSVEENCSQLSLTPGKRNELYMARQEKRDIQRSAHPGFDIFDNIDIHVDRKNMTLIYQNRDFHWVNHQYIENRVSAAFLDSSRPKIPVEDIPVIQFLPSPSDQQKQRHNYIVLTSRILVEYFVASTPLAEACVQHIPHMRKCHRKLQRFVYWL